MDSTSINFSEFKNKKILITGGSTGIGAELAKAFAKQGAIVGLHYLSSADAAKQVASEILSEGGPVELIRADASNSKAMAAAVNEAAERLGGLNGLINNAGGMVRRCHTLMLQTKTMTKSWILMRVQLSWPRKKLYPF